MNRHIVRAGGLAIGLALLLGGLDLLGVFGGYPPDGYLGQLTDSSVPGVHWEQRQHAVGAVIPHTAGQDVGNLVLVLKPSGAVGTA
jgi:hypothetical protein